MMKTASIGIVLIAMAGCSNESVPLYFSQAMTIGITAGPTAGVAGTPELTVGYKQVNLAIVPTVIPQGITLGDSDTTRRISASGRGQDAKTDALSTFGSFEGTTRHSNGETTVGLGNFFATGVAAQTLSSAFVCHLGNVTGDSCVQALQATKSLTEATNGVTSTGDTPPDTPDI